MSAWDFLGVCVKTRSINAFKHFWLIMLENLLHFLLCDLILDDSWFCVPPEVCESTDWHVKHASALFLRDTFCLRNKIPEQAGLPSVDFRSVSWCKSFLITPETQDSLSLPLSVLLQRIKHELFNPCHPGNIHEFNTSPQTLLRSAQVKEFVVTEF